LKLADWVLGSELSGIHGGEARTRLKSIIA
jgi:hypothetical protein